MKYWTLLLCCAVLSGCDSKLANQAIKEAKVAFEKQDYQEAMGLLQLASDEGANDQYAIWAKQGEAFLKMISFKDLSSLTTVQIQQPNLLLPQVFLAVLSSAINGHSPESPAPFKYILKSSIELAPQDVAGVGEPSPKSIKLLLL